MGNELFGGSTDTFEAVELIDRAVPAARNLAFQREIEILPFVPPGVGLATPSIAGMRRSGERPRGAAACAAVAALQQDS